MANLTANRWLFHTAFFDLRSMIFQIKGLWFLGDQILVLEMPSPKARFRISIKDQNSKTGIKVELIDVPKLWPDRRYRLRVNGQLPRQVKEATLTEVFDRLRRWMVRRTAQK